MPHKQGWIPYDDRDEEHQKETDAFHEECQTFGDVGSELDDLPTKAIIAEACVALTGKVPLRVRQSSGSCVGAGAAQAYYGSILGDCFYRQDTNAAEAIEFSYPYYCYGHGRFLAGMKRKGEGSWGGAQAKSIAQIGHLPMSDSRMPQPQVRDGWLTWSSRTEIDWSYSPQFPIPLDELRPTSEQYKLESITKVTDTKQARTSISQGYMLTLASNYGFKSPRVKGDVLLAARVGSWAHQMSCSGVWEHPTHGVIFLIDNQWGANAHGTCPTLSKIGRGVYGSFWITERTFGNLINDGEVYSHGLTTGFPARKLEWDDMGMG